MSKTQFIEETLSLPAPVRLGLAIFAGLLLAAGSALYPIWWAPWLAPVALIPAGRGSRFHATWTGALAGAIAMAGIFPYYVVQTGWIPACLIGLLRVVSWLGMARAAQLATQRLPLAVAGLVLPTMAAALERITLTVSPHGAAGSLAYSQMDMPALIQAATLGGVPAVVFVLLLPGSVLGAALSVGGQRSKAAVAGAVATLGAIVLAIGLYTAQRLSVPAPLRTLPVTLIASDRFHGIRENWGQVWTVYGPVVSARAQAGGLVVLPEKIALVDGAGAQGAAQDVSRVAVARHATIVAGIEVRDGGIYRNRAVIAGPDGHVIWYDKQRLVLGFEDRDVPGKSPIFFDTAAVASGVAICKDMHVPSIGREYAGRAAVMAVPAWDFGRDGWMGARMTAMRGIENGYAIARSAREGLVGAYDDRGRVIAERRSSDGMTIVDARVPAITDATLYSRIGDLFGALCSVAIVAMLAGLFLMRSLQNRAG